MHTPLRRPAFAALALYLLTAAAQAQELSTNALGMTFVSIPAGQFSMGSTKDDVDDVLFEDSRNKAEDTADETPAHTVIISKPFWLGQTEVTQELWLKLMKTRPGETDFWTREDWRQLPVVGVSWRQAQAFIKALEKADPKHKYRLPSEAEWEYAARGGKTGVRPFPLEEMEKHAWYFYGSGDKPMPVAQLQPNGFGLYDMFGNAWEWTNDWYASYPATGATRTDPTGPASGKQKVRRGGSYHCSPRLVRSAYRAPDTPDKHWPVLGFRLVMMPK